MIPNPSLEEIYMRRCLELASLGLGKVSPNPMVGAIVVWENEMGKPRIVGEGWHKKYGEAHAEVNAIEEAKDYFQKQASSTFIGDIPQSFQNCTIYVSLEPCSHFGKTPPCVDLILHHKIPKVVIACLDPNPLVSGKGVQKLQASAVEVRMGILEKEAQFLNRRFFTFHIKRRPYIILKWAETLNKKMASLDGSPITISSPLSHSLSHRWRTEEDAILIGKNTGLTDNPFLTPRLWKGKPPKRFMIDWNLEVPLESNIFNRESPTYIINGKKEGLENTIHYILIEEKKYLIPFLLFQMHIMDISSIIIEGGKKTLQKFIDSNLWDEARVFHSTKSIQLGINSPMLDRDPQNWTRFSDEEDTIFFYKNPFQG